MATEEDLSDFDIHRIMEALATRQSKVVASCTLSIKLLLTEIQQQLLDLMIEERLAENPISNSGDDISYEDRIDTPDLLPQDESPMDQVTLTDLHYVSALLGDPGYVCKMQVSVVVLANSVARATPLRSAHINYHCSFYVGLSAYLDYKVVTEYKSAI